MYGLLVKGVCVNFVIVISNKDSLIARTGFPKSTSDSWRKVRDLKNHVIYLSKENLKGEVFTDKSLKKERKKAHHFFEV